MPKNVTSAIEAGWILHDIHGTQNTSGAKTAIFVNLGHYRGCLAMSVRAVGSSTAIGYAG